MILKYLHYLGLGACLLLVISCFLPWAYYADIDKVFTGFYTYQNYYGKPGKLLIFFAVVFFVMMIIPKLWAKRVTIILSALLIGYVIKIFWNFGACYNTYCPQKLYGIYLMLFSAITILVATLFPNLKLDKK